MNYSEHIGNAKKEAYQCYFKDNIQPVLDRYNWVLYWANGAVGVDNVKGESVWDTPTLQKITEQLEQTFKYENSYYGIWWELVNYADIANGVYGHYKLPCYVKNNC